MNQHHFLDFDNVSYLSDETSDILCRAVTGAGIQERTLYTNAESTIFIYQRVITINGISNVVTKSDLLDRSILIELARISETERRGLSEVQTEFEAARPYILGAIFEVLSRAMTIYPSVKLGKLPRMADFSVYGYAIGEAIQTGGGELFLQEYSESIDEQNREAISVDPFATLVVALINEYNGWQGSATMLLKAVKQIAPANGISINSKEFPADSTRVSKRLNAMKSNLEAEGIHFERHYRNGTPIITFHKEGLNTL